MQNGIVTAAEGLDAALHCTDSGVRAQRIVRLGGPIDDDMANLVVAQLLYLDSNGKEDITMYVNSPGGSVTAGTCLQAVDWVVHAVSSCKVELRLQEAQQLT